MQLNIFYALHEMMQQCDPGYFDLTVELEISRDGGVLFENRAVLCEPDRPGIGLNLIQLSQKARGYGLKTQE